MSKSFSVHPRYIQEVNLAWRHKSDGRDRELAKKLGLSLDTVDLFLKGQLVNGLNFVEICQTLDLEWRIIAGLEPHKTEVTAPLVAVSGSKASSHSKLDGKTSTIDQALNGLVAALCEMLSRLTRKAGNLLRADRTSIFLLDRDRQELGSLIAEDGKGGSLTIDMPADRGIAALAATSLSGINIPFDVYDDPRSDMAKIVDTRTGYRTYTILAWPLLNEKKDLVAVAQFINKLKPNHNRQDTLFMRIDPFGFTPEDEALFTKFVPSIIQILERCQFCYQLAQKLRENGVIHSGGSIFPEAELIAQLKRQEEHLRKSLERI